MRDINSPYEGFILYQPLGHEVDYTQCSLPFHLDSHKVILPSDKNSNPFEWAEICKNKFRNKNICIFIPGTQFDKYGTRHGKGGGWYDRFLSKVPREWVRIGIVETSQFSHSQLERKVWDEPMDWLLIATKSTFSILPTQQQ